MRIRISFDSLFVASTSRSLVFNLRNFYPSPKQDKLNPACSFVTSFSQIKCYKPVLEDETFTLYAEQRLQLGFNCHPHNYLQLKMNNGLFRRLLYGFSLSFIFVFSAGIIDELNFSQFIYEANTIYKTAAVV